jgi:hypothetical protein
MSKQNQSDPTAKQGRQVALVIAGTMLVWLLAQVIGPQVGLAGRYAILIDLLALAAFAWSMIVIFQIWRKRQDNEG